MVDETVNHETYFKISKTVAKIRANAEPPRRYKVEDVGGFSTAMS
jgi:hypothetical protein